jgi:hypothetical protein
MQGPEGRVLTRSVTQPGRDLGLVIAIADDAKLIVSPVGLLKEPSHRQSLG